MPSKGYWCRLFWQNCAFRVELIVSSEAFNIKCSLVWTSSVLGTAGLIPHSSSVEMFALRRYLELFIVFILWPINSTLLISSIKMVNHPIGGTQGSCAAHMWGSCPPLSSPGIEILFVALSCLPENTFWTRTRVEIQLQSLHQWVTMVGQNSRGLGPGRMVWISNAFVLCVKVITDRWKEANVFVSWICSFSACAQES